MAVKLRLIGLVICFLLSGCGISQNANVANGAIGGLAGTLIGGSAGALMGNAISNGDIAQSAMVGAGIGLASGIVAGVAYNEVKQAHELASNRSKIEENYKTIIERQKEIDLLREELIFESKTIELDDSLEEKQYIGPTIGVYR